MSLCDPSQRGDLVGRIFYHDWHYHVGKVLGIPIVIHVTFLLMLVFRLIWPILMGQGLNGSISNVGLTALAFGCVFLHELGHAAAAKQFGIRTRDIVFFPIGCAAELLIPEEPRQELKIALAGPAVNLLLAILTFPLMFLFGGVESAAGKAAGIFFLVNVLILAFNMLPAFPMDGGRVLRSLLAMRFNRVKATWIAAGVAEVFAVLFFLAAFKFGASFFLIAAFVGIMALAEASVTQKKAEGHYQEEPVSFSDHPVAISA